MNPENEPHHETDPIPVELPPVAATPAAGPSEQVHLGAQVARRLFDAVNQRVLGQEDVLRQTLYALLAGGHVLLEGKPGLGKTQLVLCLAGAFGGKFARIQFTPDLMPSDVTGHSLFDMGKQTFVTRHGPVFTHLLLADEINRAPAKTQSSLLEVMQERQVTIDGQSTSIEAPFMVLATQNPIEQEGTYPLPEAQLDRFLMKVLIDYPAHEDEARIVQHVAAQHNASTLDRSTASVVTRDQVIAAQEATATIRSDDAVVDYALRLTRSTRESPGLIIGAGTRGAIALIRCAKAAALCAGRDFLIPDDVKSVALPVLRHRVTVAPELTIGGQDADDVLSALIDTTEAPRA